MTDAYERAKRDDAQWEREHDSREKLEADVRWELEHFFAWTETRERLIKQACGWLDRQKAITTRECTAVNELGCEACRAAQKREIAELQTKVDELQAQLDSYDQTHMLLPVDAGGVPIHVGERIRLDNGHEGEVWLIGAFDIMMSDHTCFDWAKSRHVQPRTIEDVLRDCCNEWNQHLGSDWEAGVYAKYADELRELMGVDDD